MGLDQYLEKRHYVGNKYRDKSAKVKIKIPKSKKGVNFPMGKIDEDKISYIIEEAGYWRKANAIHQWFVNNVQDGDDNCKDHCVDREQLEELLDLCERVKEASKLVKGKDIKVIENSEVAEELLPSQAGFFFGGTEYNECYLRDIKDTIKIIKKALKNKTCDYYYGSSW